MDAETEVSRMPECGDQAMDTDDGLDTLLRKAVTESQANLPIATINKDIDDIARAYSKENEQPDSALDDDFVRLLERTRQRRELLNQKIGKGPDATPRKRRSPLSEHLTSNVSCGPGQREESPKRQCVREQELIIKPDTPAIASVKSRLHALSAKRAYWTDNDSENQGDSTPVPIPRKSMCALEEAAKPAGAETGAKLQPSSQRKSRFAQLASSISSWEDDLSHPTIVKEEEKKQCWQPPTDTEKSASSPSTSAEGCHDHVPHSVSERSPEKSLTAPGAKLADSARRGTGMGDSGVGQTSRSPVKSCASSRPDPSRKSKSSHSQEAEAQQETYTQVGHKTETEELKLPAANRSRKDERKEMSSSTESVQKESMANKLEESKREAVKREGPKAGLETPKPVIPTSERPLSARLANWEQKISDSMSESLSTPRPAQATPLPKKVCTPAWPVSTPSVDDNDTVQLRPKPRKTMEDEPTAHPVSARMSAWEHISSNQEVCSIKKVKPSDCTPAKTNPGQKSPLKSGTPARPGTQEGIKERITQLSTPQKAANTPSKMQALLGSASKSAQWQPAQQANSSDVAAQRLRQERMAELQNIQNRWKNGVLKDDAASQSAEAPKAESIAKDRRQESRDKARADFDSKLAAVGLDAEPSKDTTPKTEAANTAAATSSSGMVSSKPPRPTSLFSIVSQQKEGATGTPRPATAATITSKACRKVKFDDSFDSDDTDALGTHKDTTDDDASPASELDGNTEEDVAVVLRRPRPAPPRVHCPKSADDDDEETSIGAFVPQSVRFDSAAMLCGQDMDTSINSLDSFEGNPGAPPDFHKSTVDLVKLGQQYADSDSCSSLHVADSMIADGSTAGSSQDTEHKRPQAGQDMEESVEDRVAIDSLLDEAMDAEDEEVADDMPIMRKKTKDRETTVGDLPFSINEYRASRNLQIQEVKQTIVRNSQYVGMSVTEEEVEMPTAAPIPVPRRSVHDRIKELQELVQQEQSVIMQTSNALNQCSSTISHFAGSSEQVECNRILLLSCQKRQAYMTEIQRLKDGGVVDPNGPGPKGSLTISDIRLPLKKDFVTKIGTSQDTMTYYFILLVRNGPQLITTQMLSTHDPMMRGSLDFPNLIKFNGITGDFQLQMDIYCMSVSCEVSGKDKKKKMPKKLKGSALTVQSPGGPLAVRTTCFTQVTTVMLSMKSVDKHCFTLDRLSHLSPLHGTIYMNLKCLMEASVEEKGFLTMFEDVSGLGSWHRRWCVLSANKLQFWKYPDDETRKEPMGSIDLKRCVTEKVGLISRDVCARPHTFELTTVRQPKKGEKDTLISRTYSTTTTVRHMLSADTKEERIVWCNMINRALSTLRTWHTDAMRPIPK